MKIINFGSLNIDHVYKVQDFVRPGETISCLKYKQFCGGKGLNQSIALAHAGSTVFHAGKIGADGKILKERLNASGIDTTLVETIQGPSGHALIQIDKDGENAIIIHGGANQKIGKTDIEKALAGFSDTDYILLQNEISNVSKIIKLSFEKGLRVIFNPAPMTLEVNSYPLENVHLFILNEIEGRGITGENNPEKILSTMRYRFPHASVVLTLGKDGVIYADSREIFRIEAINVRTVDTTAAGDTFIGFFITDLLNGLKVDAALKNACKAAAICVTKRGAADSIPARSDLEKVKFRV
jgi:ribokinase